MHVLVTGAGGFVGTRLVPRLEAEGHTVTAHDLDVDITDADAVDRAFARAKPNAVIHLAAQSSVAASLADPEGSFRINYLGTRNVLAAAQQHGPGARILVISSGDLYDQGDADARPRRESDPLHPNSPYAKGKAAAEQWATCEAERGADIVRIRAFNHTGAGQTDRFVASHFARQICDIERGTQPSSLRVGNLDSVRDFLDVDDVIEAYRLLLNPAVPADIYNVASGKPITIGEILETLIDHSSVRPTIEVDPDLFRPTDRLVGDATRLREATGWEPRIPFSSTLEGLLAFWRQNPR